MSIPSGSSGEGEKRGEREERERQFETVGVKGEHEGEKGQIEEVTIGQEEGQSP